MATIKTRELSGPALDWAVAQCENANGHSKYGKPCFDPKTKRVYQNEGLRLIGVNFSPSKDWSQAGAIIERERIGVWWDGVWHSKYDGCKPGQVQDADDPLIAAMRCYVASKMGDNVEIPDSLVSLIVKE